ncbi:hypothetical protein D9K80_06515 [Acinetobacter cumulans]|uniref:DNA 3'-5' helicase n=1 Tax=Acinetobacter cumulans TaxID=2136182 RepID=A0A498CXQ6_9GAMM|nr:3'-5' exonuclease [Acinetobacter cumulans]RLL36223.1 hypothetical protein D9K80_06515 [Acinetobacter cumulans]
MMLQFNADQLKVIQLREGYHACLAPAGSGKTEVLTERIVQALARNVKADDILCLTFTNRAGLNMREKVTARLAKNFPQLFIGNLHAFCFKLLMKHYDSQHRDLINEELQKRLIRQALEQLNALLIQPHHEVLVQLQHCLTRYELKANALDGFDPQALNYCHYSIFKNEDPYALWNMEAIRNLCLPLISEARHFLKPEQKSYIRSRLRTLDQNIPDHCVKYAFVLAVYFNEAYQALKKHYHFYDYDDLIIDALVLQNQPKAKRYGWIQIDEVQDLSPLHWLLVDHLTAKDAHILILGDVNQSIYRFQGASVELTQERLGQNVHVLEENYRSPDNLVQLSNQYMASSLDPAYKITARAHKKSHPRALLHLHREFDTEHTADLIQHIRKLNQKDESTAVLLSTNRQADAFSDQLNQHELRHFFVAQNDLLSREFYLDFMAFVSALKDPENRLAWARLLWRFGNIQHYKPTHLKETEAQFAAIQLIHELREHGCWLNNFINISDCYQHQQQCLIQHIQNNSFAYFDTETTGLDLALNDIVQIAAVTQDQELNLYCLSDQDLSESYKIHGIDASVLAKHGLDAKQQLHTFMQFSHDKALIAHNLKFDQAMLTENLKRYAPELSDIFFSQHKFCTLELTRQLFPNLDSYKLGHLLAHFKLDGENSHNALDDVKAGRALLNPLLAKIQQNETALSAYIAQAEKCLNAFNQNFSPLWNLAQYSIRHNGDFKIQQLFKLYTHYMQAFNPQLYEAHIDTSIEQLRVKLLNHANYHFEHIHNPYQYFDEAIPFYQTAKESDLITPNDQLIVSTIHRSKGLEFDHVILPDLTHQNFPGYMVVKKQNSESQLHQNEGHQLYKEQKRLLYVAITRAKQSLTIGSYNLKSIEQSWYKPRHYKITSFMHKHQANFESI